MTDFQCSTGEFFCNVMAAPENAAAQKQKFAEPVKGMDPETHVFTHITPPKVENTHVFPIQNQKDHGTAHVFPITKYKTHGNAHVFPHSKHPVA